MEALITEHQSAIDAGWMNTDPKHSAYWGHWTFIESDETYGFDLFNCTESHADRLNLPTRFRKIFWEIKENED